MFPRPALPLRASDEYAKPHLAFLNLDTIFLALGILASSTIVRRDLCQKITQLKRKQECWTCSIAITRKRTNWSEMIEKVDGMVEGRCQNSDGENSTLEQVGRNTYRYDTLQTWL